MRTSHRYLGLLLIGSTLLVSCSPEAQSGSADGAASTPARIKTLTLGEHYETSVLARKYTSGLGSGAKDILNSGLVTVDGQGLVRPYLAEAVPQVNTDSWRVFPDGRMETTYHLRPNLTWHDGTPLSAQDFALAYRIFVHPELAVFGVAPQDRMEQVTAPDERTVLIRWKSPTLDAGRLDEDLFPAMPRHLLEKPFNDVLSNALAQEAFLNLPYWRAEFVGLGPWKLNRWEMGAFVEAEAFAGHVFGRPKIDRIIVQAITDENTMLSNVLAERVHFTLSLALRFEHGEVLLREWAANQRGSVIYNPVQPRHVQFQFRPEYLNPPALADLRVRRAIVHGLNRQDIVEGLFDGRVPVSEFFVPNTVANWADMDRTARKYPFDPRQAETLMSEAGFRKAANGFYASPAGQQFAFENMVVGGSQNERQGAIMADGWRRVGFDVTPTILPANLTQSGEARGTFPGLSSVASGDFSSWASAGISGAHNRWFGVNRGGFSHPDYDIAFDRYHSSLDPAERLRLEVEMMRIVAENVGAIYVFHSPTVYAYLNELVGPAPIAPDGSITWNLHEWDLKS